ncbi:unnamed protein product [Prunus armeniaca]
MKLNLDLLEGECEKTIIRVASHHLQNVLRETQGNDHKGPSGDAAHKKRPKGDAGCARNILREVSKFLSVP